MAHGTQPFHQPWSTVTTHVETLMLLQYSFLYTLGPTLKRNNLLPATGQENGKTAYVQKIDRAVLGWTGSSEPHGAWSKGALTTSLCQFIEHFAWVHELESSGDERLRLIVLWQRGRLWVYFQLMFFLLCFQQMFFLLRLAPFFCGWCLREASCSRALNFWMREMYRESTWIAAEKAVVLNGACKHFLQGFSRLAFLSLGGRQCLYGLAPKGHMLWHVWHHMATEAVAGAWVWNPMTFSCSMDEDFIGRYCLLTRSVSPRTRIQRSLERYLTQVQLLWRHSGRKG